MIRHRFKVLLMQETALCCGWVMNRIILRNQMIAWLEERRDCAA